MPTHLRIVALVTTLIFSVVLFGRILVVQANPTSIVPSLGASAVTIPTVESDHPYENSADKFWTIANTGGQSAARIHFSRIDLESGVDKIEIRDAENTLIQEITTSSPDGLWSDTVPGASIRVTLKTDRSGQYWGFGIDQLEPVAYTTLGYSPHPYLNGSTAVKTLVNNTPGPAGTRVRFDRIELEDGVDYIVIKDLNDTPYQWITGSYPNGLTSKAVPGSAIKVQLVTDSADRAWGYNIATVETANSDVADVAPLRTALAESDHPYTGAANQVWTLTNPDANATATKLHFSRVELNGAILQVLDANDTVIQTYGWNSNLQDVWSDYIPGRIVKLKLTYQCCDAWWGFRADAIVNSVPNPGLAQSDHPNTSTPNQAWTVTNPDVNATSSKLHFSRVELNGATLQVLDANDTVIQTYGWNSNLQDVWSDYVPGRIVKLKLTYQCCDAWWGFRADAIEPSSTQNPSPAGLNALLVQVNAPGDIFLNGTKLFSVSYAGEYRVPLTSGVGVIGGALAGADLSAATAGVYAIRIDYITGYSQTIQATIGADGGIKVVYLPLVKK